MNTQESGLYHLTYKTMTATERDRLIIVEQNQRNMQEDISELKDDVKEILTRLDNLSGGKQALMWITGTFIAVAGVLAALIGAIHLNNK